MKRNPVGHPGSWFADVDGERLPCVHDYWFKGKPMRYCDPHAANDGKWVEFIEVMKSTRRVLNTRENEDGRRTGYICIFNIENVRFDADGLCFDVVSREAL